MLVHAMLVHSNKQLLQKPASCLKPHAPAGSQTCRAVAAKRLPVRQRVAKEEEEATAAAWGVAEGSWAASAVP